LRCKPGITDRRFFARRGPLEKKKKNTDELLLRFLRFGPNKGEVLCLEPLSAQDWEELIQESVKQNITPLLYDSLQKVPDMPVPANVSERLREAYLRSAARNMRLYHELGRLLGILRHDEIPVVLLKGVHLAQFVYQNIALRPMGDVDLLVRGNDLARIDQRMIEAGYLPTESNREVSENNFEFIYKHSKSGLSVEVHWRIHHSADLPEIEVEGLWNRSRTASLAGVETRVLCPEDLLLHLCLHNAKHVFEMGVRSLYDVSRVLEFYGREIDAEKVNLRARQWGMAKGLFFTLRLARDLFGAPISDKWIDSLKPDDFDERFLVIAKEQIFMRRQRTHEGLGLTYNITRSLSEERLIDKMVLILKRAFPSSKEMSLTYPAPYNSVRIYLYYPVRIKELLMRYARQVCRLWRGDKEMAALFEQENGIDSLRQWMMSS